MTDMSCVFRSFPSIAFALLVASCVATEPDTAQKGGKGTPHLLNPADLQLLQRSVADETLIPDRARVSGVVASADASGTISACGYVSGIEFTGTYGPHRAFFGVFGDNMAGKRVFVLPSRIAQDSTGQQAIEIVCTRQGMPMGVATVSANRADSQRIKELLAIERDLNRRCRGTEGANTASTVCQQRDKAGRDLNAVGWCYGRQGEFGYQNEWHVCDANSIRLKP